MAVAPGATSAAMKACRLGGREIGDLGEAEAAGSGSAVLDLDGAGDQDLALAAARCRRCGCCDGYAVPGRGRTDVEAVELINSRMTGIDAPNLRTSRSYYINCHRNPTVTVTPPQPPD